MVYTQMSTGQRSYRMFIELGRPQIPKIDAQFDIVPQRFMPQRSVAEILASSQRQNLNISSSILAPKRAGADQNLTAYSLKGIKHLRNFGEFYTKIVGLYTIYRYYRETTSPETPQRLVLLTLAGCIRETAFESGIRAKTLYI